MTKLHSIPLYLKDEEKKMLDALEKIESFRRQEFFRRKLKEEFKKRKLKL